MRESRHGKQGSALLLTTVVIVLIIGLGGAFLAVTGANQKNQFVINEADEAQMICDAGFEKVRRALFVYKSSGSWTWDSILTYCQGSGIQKQVSNMPKDLASLWKTTPFELEAGRTGMDPSPEAPLLPNVVFIGQYTPFAHGAFYAVVTNNDDSNITDAAGLKGSPTHDTDNTVIITVVATTRSGVQRRISATVQYNSPKSSGPQLAAIVSRDAISFNGNITIDGNDHDINGKLNHKADSWAAMSGSTVGIGGSSAAGGNGNPPSGKGATLKSLDQSVTDWSAMNNPPSTGGPTPTGYPPDADGVMKAPPGSLKAAAIAGGSYFTTQGAYDAWVAAYSATSVPPGQMPGNKVIYCDFTPGPPFTLGSTLNTEPSILVVHNSTGTADMKNVHGDFKGLIIADSVTHINAGTWILGSVVAWGQGGNVFGNGNSEVDYSSDVLKDLPGLKPASSLLVLGYRKEVPAGATGYVP